MKKFIAASCSHGEIINPSARYEVLTFADQFKPDTVLHLGDFIDTTAFRAGGNHTEGGNVSHDIDAGFNFVSELFGFARSRKYLFCGNHEDRLWRLANDTRPLIADLAQKLISDIYALATRNDAELFEYRNGSMWRLLGDTLFGHGVMFNEFAARDHAEMLGRSCVFGHTHKLVQSPARTNRRAIGYNIGWLGDVAKADYAKVRRATTAWQNGFAWGYYDDRRCVVNLQQCRERVIHEEAQRIG